ncbi:MAG: hypothetical protein ACE5OW_03725 [Candidatus Bathyarchaeia archaeon]
MIHTVWFFDEPQKIARIDAALKELRDYIRNTYAESRRHTLTGDFDFTGLSDYEIFRSPDEFHLHREEGGGYIVVSAKEVAHTLEEAYSDVVKPLKQGKHGVHWFGIVDFRQIPKDIILKFKHSCRNHDCLDFFRFMLDEWERFSKEIFQQASLFRDKNRKERILRFDDYRLW